MSESTLYIERESIKKELKEIEEIYKSINEKRWELHQQLIELEIELINKRSDKNV